MDRASFIKKSCLACAGIGLGISVMESCSPAVYMNLPRTDRGWQVPESTFTRARNGKLEELDYIILDLEGLKHPVCLSKHKNEGYLALSMRCTHRGCTVNRGGGIFACPCHGSEFDLDGRVLEGPAQENLEIISTRIEDEIIYLERA